MSYHSQTPAIVHCSPFRAATDRQKHFSRGGKSATLAIVTSSQLYAFAYQLVLNFSGLLSRSLRCAATVDPSHGDELR